MNARLSEREKYNCGVFVIVVAVTALLSLCNRLQMWGNIIEKNEQSDDSTNSSNMSFIESLFFSGIENEGDLSFYIHYFCTLEWARMHLPTTRLCTERQLASRWIKKTRSAPKIIINRAELMHWWKTCAQHKKN